VKKVPKSSRGLWAIRVPLPSERPAELAADVEGVLEPLGVALSSFEGAGGQGWSVEVLCEQRPRAADVRSALKAIGAPPAVIAYVPPKNWVAETQRLLAPLRIGRFFVHGAHFDGQPPRGAIPLLIDASIAFGTGRHTKRARQCTRPHQVPEPQPRTGSDPEDARKTHRPPMCSRTASMTLSTASSGIATAVS
jgi:hypothetical protein